MNDDPTTFLQWAFEPKDLFEEIFDVEILSGSVHIGRGVARGRFPPSVYERGREFRDEAHRALEPHFFGQAIIAGKRFVLNPAQLTREHPDGCSDETIFLETAQFTLSGSSATANFITRDRDGNIASDTRTERIAEQARFRTKLVEALPDFPEIRAMAESFNKSFEDEANCFVHLYEVRDRISTIFDGEKKAKKALNVKDDWRSIGTLSNEPDNALGRHRGMGSDHKRPGQEDLQKGRNATRRLIEAYIDHVNRS